MAIDDAQRFENIVLTLKLMVDNNSKIQSAGNTLDITNLIVYTYFSNTFICINN